MFRHWLLSVLGLYLVCFGPSRSLAANGYYIIVNDSGTLQYTLYVHWATGACAGSWTSEGNYYANPGSNWVADVPCSGTPTDKAHFVWFSTTCSSTNGSGFPQTEVLLNGGAVVNSCLGAVTTNAPTQSFTATVKNDSGKLAVAWFKMNGAVMYTQYLSPGGSASYTYTWTGNASIDYGYNIDQTLTQIDAGGNFVVTNVILSTDTNLGTIATAPGTAPPVPPISSSGYTNFQLSGNTLSTNGIINFNNTATNLALDSTLKSGFNGLATELDTANGILGQIASKNWSNTWAISNNVVVSNGAPILNATNDVAYLSWMSNYMWWATNYVKGLVYTNDLIQAAASNFASQYASGATSLTNPWMSTISGVPAPSDEDGGVITIDIPSFSLGGYHDMGDTHQVKIDVTAAVYNTIKLVKPIWSASLYLWLWYCCITTLYKYMRWLAIIPQLNSLGQSYFGTNGKLIAIALVVAAVGATSYVFYSDIVSHIVGGTAATGMAAFGSSIGAYKVASGQVWKVITAVVPISDMIGVATGWVTFKLTAEPASIYAGNFIRATVGF